MKNKWKIARRAAFFILFCAAGVLIAVPYFTAKELQPEESILSLAETLHGQRDKLERLEKQKKETPQDRKSLETIVKLEAEIEQTMQRTVAAYREKLRQEMKQFHELETRVKQLSQNDAEQRLYQELIDVLKQNQANIIFWLQRSVQIAPRCYCVPQDIYIFLGGR